MTLYTHHLPKWKRDEVEDIKKHASQYKVVGVVDMHGIPAHQLQKIRGGLREISLIKMTRNTLVEQALTEIGGAFAEMKSLIGGQSALIFTDANPFRLYKLLEQTKTKMPAKAGEIAPEDIVVQKGPTSFKPGPIVAELQQAGIPAAIEGGKVRIRETKTVVRQGEVISRKVADILAKLEIKPMDVGLNLVGGYSEGVIYRPEQLAIDDVAFMADVMRAAQHGFNLSLNAAIPVRQTIRPLIGKAFIEARALGVQAPVYDRSIIDLIIGKAQSEMSALKNIAKNA
ncbi:MAG: 50S ribosomal protein L10 [Methanomicrobiales archaeon]|nr:50S ribosomal protein L10 [Methanomicrobiales archaeon]